MGDELRGELPAFRIALAPARVVLQGAGYDDARHRGLDDVRICVRDPSETTAASEKESSDAGQEICRTAIDIQMSNDYLSLPHEQSSA